MLTYVCPVTHRIVETAIETTESKLRQLRAMKLSLWCPHCQTGHAVSAKATSVISELIASPARDSGSLPNQIR